MQIWISNYFIPPLVQIFTDHSPSIIPITIQLLLFIRKLINLCVERHILRQRTDEELIMWVLLYPGCPLSRLCPQPYVTFFTSPFPSSHATQCAFSPEIATPVSFPLTLLRTPQYSLRGVENNSLTELPLSLLVVTIRKQNMHVSRTVTLNDNGCLLWDGTYAYESLWETHI